MGSNNKRIDIVGQTFGEWKVLEYAGDMRWKCRCSCGVIKDVYGTSLKQGKSVSCGHDKKKPTIDLTGQTFNDLKVLRYDTAGKWVCECICGNTKVARGYDLVNKLVTSCGHKNINRNSIIGNTYGAWTVIGLSDSKRHVQCRCECSNVVDVNYHTLLSGASTNCGCKNKVDLVGNTYGELTVLGYNGNQTWYCICSCGSHKVLRTSSLVNNLIRSCGCKTTELKRSTMLERYNETAASRINNPRYIESIQASHDRLKMVEKIDELDRKKDQLPKVSDLADELDINIGSTKRILKKQGLLGLVKTNVFGKTEEDLALLIESMGVEIVRKSRNIIPPLELDIYVPELKLAIEFNGTYWHSDAMKEKRYHQQKTIECAINGIRLIHIFEYEWVDADKQYKIVELLKTIIQPSNNKVVYARKTKLTEINYSDTRKFLNENHLQGEATAHVNIALHYEDKLIALMTFGKPRFNNECEWELVRLAYQNGTAVVGGAEKMFKHFITKYDPTSIISYCNIAKFTGKVYQRLGFSTTARDITDPNYVWVDQHNESVIPRYKAMKHKLIAKGLGTAAQTEAGIMQSLGYARIYDSGNLKFIWNKPEETGEENEA